MENFVSVVHELEKLWAAIDVNKTDIDRMDDIAEVLGYSGRVVLAFDTVPDLIEPSDYGVSSFASDDQALVKFGHERGIYKIIDVGGGQYRLDMETPPILLDEICIVVLKRVEEGHIIEHKVLLCTKGMWHERVLTSMNA